MADSPLVAAPAVTGGRDELGGGAVALPVGTGTDVMVPGTVTEAVSDSVWGGAVSVSVGCVSVGWLSAAVSVCVGVTVLVSVWAFVFRSDLRAQQAMNPAATPGSHSVTQRNAAFRSPCGRSATMAACAA